MLFFLDVCDEVKKTTKSDVVFTSHHNIAQLDRLEEILKPPRFVANMDHHLGSEQVSPEFLKRIDYSKKLLIGDNVALLSSI